MESFQRTLELWAGVLFQVTSVQGPSMCLIKLYSELINYTVFA